VDVLLAVNQRDFDDYLALFSRELSTSSHVSAAGARIHTVSRRLCVWLWLCPVVVGMGQQRVVCVFPRIVCVFGGGAGVLLHVLLVWSPLVGALSEYKVLGCSSLHTPTFRQ
jgi:hypothetical protein